MLLSSHYWREGWVSLEKYFFAMLANMIIVGSSVTGKKVDSGVSTWKHSLDFGILCLPYGPQEQGHPLSACLLQYSAEPDSCKCEGLVPKFFAKCEGLVPKFFAKCEGLVPKTLASVSNQFCELVGPVIQLTALINFIKETIAHYTSSYAPICSQF